MKKIFRWSLIAISSLWLSLPATAQTTATQDDGVPQTVEQWKAFIKEVYFNKYYDFNKASNGAQVFTKYYKNWRGSDLKTLKQYAPLTFRFLAEAASPQHFAGKGQQVLGELLPDYYRTHGGVMAFRNDINSLLP